jgi:hypothetical protein
MLSHNYISDELYLFHYSSFHQVDANFFKAFIKHSCNDLVKQLENVVTLFEFAFPSLFRE